MQRIVSIMAGLVVASCTSVTSLQKVKMADAVKLDSKTTVNKKVESLLPQLTLKEKGYLWHGCSGFEVGGIKRLGIPRIKMTDGPQGVRGPTSTYFPSGIAMAASWNEQLMEQVGAALGRETRAAGCSVLLGPGVNIMRTPLCGRNFEYFGEDPLLAGKIAAAYIRGVQSENVAACVKHLVGNNQEWCRTTGSSEIGKRALHEIYLPAFEIACKEGNSWAIMSAYNKVNGTFASANRYIQQDIPKKQWGWSGAMISDWGGAHDWKGCVTGGLDIIMPQTNPKFIDKMLDAIEKGDIAKKILTEHSRRALRLIYRTKEVKGKEANTLKHQMLSRELARESITLLKNDAILPLSTNLKSIAVIGPNAHKQHSMDGVRGSGGSGAVNPPYEITPLAGLKKLIGDAVKLNYVKYSDGKDKLCIIPSENLKTGDRNGLLGEYFANINLEGKAISKKISGSINFNWTTQVATSGLPKDRFSIRWSGKLIAPRTGMYELGIKSDDGSRLFIDDKEVINNWRDQAATLKTVKMELQAGKSYALRLEYYDVIGDAMVKLLWRVPKGKNAKKPFTKEIEVAKNSEVVIVFAGINHSYDREALGWGLVPNSDRPDLELIGPQADLINAVAKVNPNVIVVLIGGGPLNVEQWQQHVKGIVMAWYPGQEGGNAIAEILFGKVNPSGKLCCSWGKRLNDWACHANGNYPGEKNGPVLYEDGIWVGYRHFEKKNITPRYPFGHGLSYTTFSITNLKVTRNGKNFIASCTVSNTGDREGSEVVQLYVSDEECSVERPIKELKGFCKVKLQAKESKLVEFTITPRDLAFYDILKKDWITETGKFKISVGSSSAKIMETTTITN